MYTPFLTILNILFVPMEILEEKFYLNCDLTFSLKVFTLNKAN